MSKFDEYRAAVLLDYEQRKERNEFSLELSHPTPKNLKEEAIKACQTRFQESDESALASFFRRRQNGPDYVSEIVESKVSCFKPICNFLRGQTTEPLVRQVELLAWLTDFKHRPFQEYLNLKMVKNTEPRTDVIDHQLVDHYQQEEHGIDERPDEEKKSSLSKVIQGRPLWLFMVLLFIIIIAYLIFIGKRKCMHWEGDGYQVIYCDTSPADGKVIPFDEAKLARFRMITRYDTLTTYSLGKVWYVKVKDDYEFYTSDDVHPTNPALKLKPLTDYILNTVVRQKRNQLLLSPGRH